ncbi:hypothetical protein [Thermostilla marina]
MRSLLLPAAAFAAFCLSAPAFADGFEMYSGGLHSTVYSGGSMSVTTVGHFGHGAGCTCGHCGHGGPTIIQPPVPGHPTVIIPHPGHPPVVIPHRYPRYYTPYYGRSYHHRSDHGGFGFQTPRFGFRILW